MRDECEVTLVVPDATTEEKFPLVLWPNNRTYRTEYLLIQSALDKQPTFRYVGPREELVKMLLSRGRHDCIANITPVERPGRITLAPTTEG